MARQIESERETASQPKVIVVGAGPAGLFAACELLRHGVRPRVIESRLEPHHETRGTAIQPAVLETLDRAGVLNPFLNQSVRIHEFELMGPGQRQIALAEIAGLGCKYEFECSQPQWFTESVLRDHLADLRLAVEFGAEATSIEPEAEGLRVTLVKDGRNEIVATLSRT
jgi:2-polyprenyl-6-methoxyphenol hydroxylase-like FAD-dependent oxidoreductase